MAELHVVLPYFKKQTPLPSCFPVLSSVPESILPYGVAVGLGTTRIRFSFLPLSPQLFMVLNPKIEKGYFKPSRISELEQQS